MFRMGKGKLVWFDHSEEVGGRRQGWSGDQAESGRLASPVGFCVPRTRLKG